MHLCIYHVSRRRRLLCGAAAVVFAFFLFTQFFIQPAQAATLTLEQEQELAAISFQLDAIRQLITTLVSALGTTAHAQTASTTAPTNISIGWYKGFYGTPPAGAYTLAISFQYPLNLSDVQSFRLYLQKPGESAFSAVATFANPSSIDSACGSYVYSGSWKVRNCTTSGGGYWQIFDSGGQSSSYPIGEYNAYLTAVDTAGAEGPVSATAKNIVSRTTVTSPVGAQNSLIPTFRWTVPGGWPGGSFWPQVYEGANYIWSRAFSSAAGATEGTAVYDGPALDPSKTYLVNIWAEGNDSAGIRYFSMGESSPSFTVSAPINKPDLTVLDIYDESGKLSVKISNIGTAPAPSGVGNLHIWIDDVLQWTYSLSTLADQSFLVAGGVSVVQPQVLSGGHKIKATIDPQSAIDESNENNNTLEKTPIFSGASPDVVPPSQPTGLFATAVSASQINLSWSASTDAVGVAGYRIYRGGVQIVATSGTAYFDTGLSAGTTYNYAVAAYDAAGNVSLQSGSANATTPALTNVALVAPSNLATQLLSVSEKSASIYLTWSDNSDNESEFRVFKRPGGGEWSKFRATGASAQATYSTSDIATSSGAYEYKVQACNSLGCSAESNIASITVTLPVYSMAPATPSNLAVRLLSISEKSASLYLTWNDNSDNESEFRVFKRPGGGEWSKFRITGASAQATYSTSDTATSSGAYEYKVQACNSLGCSAESNIASIAVTLPIYSAAPTAPSNLAAQILSITEKSASMYLTWNDNSDNESEFRVFKRPGGGEWSKFRITGASAQATYSTSDTATSSGVYEYKVQACNSIGCSAESNTASVSAALLVVTILSPSNATAAIISLDAGAKISVSWSDNADNETGYRVYRRLMNGTWIEIGSTGAFAGGTAKFSDIVLFSGSYEYKVRACNALGCSSDSNTASLFVSLPVTAPPLAPSNAAAKVSSVTEKGASVYVSWIDASDNEAEFRVSRRLAGGVWFEIQTVNIATGAGFGSTRAISDTVTLSGTFEYKVRACNALGCSPDSNSASVAVIVPVYTAAPAIPSYVSAKVSSVSEKSASIALAWTDNADNETEFKVFRRIAGGTWFQALTASASQGNTANAYDTITISGSFEYKIQACNSIGCSSDSSVATVAVALPVYMASPLAPSNVTARITLVSEKSATVYVTWNDNSLNEAEFRVQRRLNGGTWFQVATAQAGAGTSAAISDAVTVSGTFEYRAQACNSVGCSDFSPNAFVSVTSLPYPAASTATTGSCLAPGNIYTITWNTTGVTGVDSWALRYTTDNGATFTAITELPSSANSYGWKAPSLESSQVKVEVRGWSASQNTFIALGISDTLLTISSSCGVTAITIALPTPVTIPAVPLNLAASPGSILTDKEAYIALSWTDASDNEAEFKIYRRLPDGSWVYKGRMLVNSARMTDVVYSSGLYEYKAQACNTLGCSVDSNIATIIITLPVPLAVPNAPLNMKAIQGSVLTDKESYITLSWTDASDNEAEFKVYRRLPDGSWVYKGRTLANGARMTDVVYSSGLYEYKAQACNTLGCSPDSDVAGITITLPVPLTVPKAPSNLKAIIGSVITDKEAYVALSWIDNSDNEAEFRIYRRRSDTAWEYKGRTLANGIRMTDVVYSSGFYEYKAQACNTLGCSEFSAVATVAITLLAAPQPTATSTPVVVPPVSATLAVSLAATPFSGPAPLGGVDLIAQTSGTAEGAINYTLYCNRSDGGTDIIAGYAAKYDGSLEITKTASDICAYQSAGTYSAKVIAERGGLSAEARTTITVSQPLAPVLVLAPNGGEIFTQGANNTVSWSGGKNKVQVGLVEPQYNPKTGVALGWIRVLALPANSIVWDAKELQSLDGKERWTVAPGSYRIAAISENGSGAYCAGDNFPDCNIDVSDAPFTIVAPPADAIVKIIALDVSGQPLSGVSVNISAKDFSRNFSGVTGGDGAFTARVSAGTYIVEAYAPAGADLIKPSPIEFIVAAGETKEARLQFSRPIKIIQGFVAYTNRDPVPDAQVRAYNESSGQWLSALTDAAGNYSIRVGSGRWMVGVTPVDPIVARWRTPDQYQYAEFDAGFASETRTVSFTVPSADAKITARAVDQNNKPIPDAGVVLDMKGAAEPKPDALVGVPAEFRKTDSNGLAVFLTRPGQYYLRAFLPQESGFVNPAEEAVRVTAREAKEITIVFRKKEEAALTTVNGTVELENGAGVASSVWAWSEKGRALNVKTDERGNFTMQVSSNEKWHVGAGQEVSNFSYKSSEVITDAAVSSLVIDLTLTRAGARPMPDPVTVSGESSRPVIAQLNDKAKVFVPGGAAPESERVTVAVTPTTDVPSQPAAKVVGTAYDVTIRDQRGREVTALQQEVEIALPYDEATLKALGVREEQMVPSFFDETTGVWVKVDTYTIDTKNKTVVARVKHLTRFAIVAPADITPPAPPTAVMVQRTKDGKIALGWTNPKSDFRHVKIYRSVQKGVLGDIVSAETFGAAQTDSGFKEGAAYYYTIRSVDPAGNESTNTNQAVVAPSKISLTAEKTGGVLSKNLFFGIANDSEVKALQGLLANLGIYRGPVTGNFFSMTKAAVMNFQARYAADVLRPAGLANPSGFVGPLTRAKLNQLAGAPGSAAAQPTAVAGKPVVQAGALPGRQLTRSVSYGNTDNADVKLLQEWLMKLGFYSGPVSGNFFALTEQAVTAFQVQYGLSVSGIVDLETQAALNKLFGE